MLAFIQPITDSAATLALILFQIRCHQQIHQMLFIMEQFDIYRDIYGYMHIYLVDLSYLELSLKRWSQCLLCPLAFLVRIRQRKEALTIHLSKMHFGTAY